MRVHVFNGKTWIYACSINARIGMRIIQGVIKRVTKANVWVESSIPGYQETGYPCPQPTMTLQMARPYLQYDIEYKEESGNWSFVASAITESAAMRKTKRYQEKSGGECRYVLHERTSG